MADDLFGAVPEKPEKVANEDAIQKVARAIYAMIPRKTKGVLGTINAIRNEAYKRTMSDEYSFTRKPKPREPITPEQRAHWEEMAKKRK